MQLHRRSAVELEVIRECYELLLRAKLSVHEDLRRRRELRQQIDELKF